MPRLLLLAALLLGPFPGSRGHGRLVDPPSRSSMWRYGYRTPKNYNDMELFCGGLHRQARNGGRCGVCGDPWDSRQPRDNEARGKYAKGLVVRTYSEGSAFNATVQLTANHMGSFEFRVCPATDESREVTQECLDRFLLHREDAGSGNAYRLPPGSGTGLFTVPLRLPRNLKCQRCVFQWTYTAGNNWGVCDDGSGRVGCGPQETFRGCADIRIEGEAESPTTNASSPRPPGRRKGRKRPSGRDAVTEPSTTVATLGTRRPECHAVGVWANVPGMGDWCLANCLHVPSYCPASHCSCSSSS